jgi:hypothetical protein
MLNDDLIAYLQPSPNRFDVNSWRDVTGTITDIRAEPQRFVLRALLPPGLYRVRMETTTGAFDMGTAMVNMVRVPDGKAVPVGPWDLHPTGPFMAMPMARVYVNGKLRGGLWFTMPGPEQIAEGWLSADFGFEAEVGQTELALEFSERDHTRLDWGRMRFMEVRRDDRDICPLLPTSPRHPRVGLKTKEISALRTRLLADPRFLAIMERHRAGDIDKIRILDNFCEIDLECLAYLLTANKAIGQKLSQRIVEECRLPIWSGHDESVDPLIMGGENDRQIGLRLYACAIAWDWAAGAFTKTERKLVLAKVREYLQKSYDFTVTQRAYMGYASIDPHSLGTWNGVGAACMAFYDDLDIARKALPFFHGLMCRSLKLFPASGKSPWATYFPMHLVRYMAAASTFGGHQSELNHSPFLDNLAASLCACFQTPNTQEMQRGLRTREHRYLTAYLHRFHPTRGIAAIYQRFVEEEKKATGGVQWGLFDLLYGPTKPVKAAQFPTLPMLAHDIGDIIGTTRGRANVGFSLSAGHKAGKKAAFALMSHNREFMMSMAALEVSVDGSPILVNINISTYGLNSALTNTMCFEDGGMFTNGQYLNGEIGPEKCGQLLRAVITGRFVYAHAIITASLHPNLKVTQADRIMIVDRQTGTILLADSFAGTRPIRFATHLHCSGFATAQAAGVYRLTGGQANLIAGIKDGDKGMSEEEKGELFVTVLDAPAGHRVSIQEPPWIPGYIYGINDRKNTDPSKAKYPHYHRWRLEVGTPVTSGSFLCVLTTRPGTVTQKREQVSLPEKAWAKFPAGKVVNALGCQCVAEAVMVDETAGCIVLAGASSIVRGNRRLQFAIPVDVDFSVAAERVWGVFYSPAAAGLLTQAGFAVRRPKHQEYNPRSIWNYSTVFSSINI